MTDQHMTLERIKSADTVPSMESFPSGALTSQALLTRIDERSTMTDTLTPIRLDEPAKPPRSNRGPLLAIAVAAVVLIVVGLASIAFIGGDEGVPATSEPTTTLDPNALPADTPPLEVVETYSARMRVGDVAGYEALASPDSGLFDGTTAETVRRDAFYFIATGATSERACEQTAPGEVTCSAVIHSGLAPVSTVIEEVEIYTVSEGLITNIVTVDGDYTPLSLNDEAGLDAYRTWMRDNDPDAFAELFAFGQTILVDTPEQRAAHQEQVARFLASARALPADTPILDVVAAYHERWDAGDIAGYEALVDPGASLFTQSGAAEGVAAASQYQLVTGVATERECSQAASTRVNCFTTFISGLAPGEVINEDFTVYVVEDGKIQNFEFPEGFTPLLEADSANLLRYREWLRTADPDRFRDLFDSSGTIVLDTAEIRSAHQALAERYRTETAGG